MGGRQGFYISGLDLTETWLQNQQLLCAPPDSDLGCVTPRFQPEQLGGAWCPAQRRRMMTSRRGVLSSRQFGWGLEVWDCKRFTCDLSLKAEKWPTLKKNIYLVNLHVRSFTKSRCRHMQFSEQAIIWGFAWLSDFTFTFHFHALEKKWQPTPVFLPGESQGWGSLVGCRLWGCTESDTTEAT